MCHGSGPRQFGACAVTNNEPRITFHGAAGTVTGSCMELEHDGRALLIDCGLFQGPRTLETLNREPFSFAARQLDAVVLPHAHLHPSAHSPKLTTKTLPEGHVGKERGRPGK